MPLLQAAKPLQGSVSPCMQSAVPSETLTNSSTRCNERHNLLLKIKSWIQVLSPRRVFCLKCHSFWDAATSGAPSLYHSSHRCPLFKQPSHKSFLLNGCLSMRKGILGLSYVGRSSFRRVANTAPCASTHVNRIHHRRQPRNEYFKRNICTQYCYSEKLSSSSLPCLTKARKEIHQVIHRTSQCVHHLWLHLGSPNVDVAKRDQQNSAFETFNVSNYQCFSLGPSNVNGAKVVCSCDLWLKAYSESEVTSVLWWELVHQPWFVSLSPMPRPAVKRSITQSCVHRVRPALSRTHTLHLHAPGAGLPQPRWPRCIHWRALEHESQLKDEMADVTAEMETLEGGDDGKNNPKSKQMSIGRKKFNMDPKKGIEYLIDHGLLKNTPDDISKFLYNGEGLNKTAIGDYLGERHDFNQTVLDSFVALHNFTDLILVQALRQFLWSFRLPGEAQKIDRMMERFARHYCDLNPTIFKHPDTCFVLSFAIIMLNTSLHNPAVKDKQTLEQFINMNRGIDNGDDLPRELLESLYESIKTEPFKIPEDDGNDLMHTFFNPDREGWLWKQGGRYKSWKRRWFILNDNCLYYFEFTTDKEPRGIIPLENIEVREVHDRNKPHCFELYATSTDFIKACKTDSEGKVVEGKHTVYRMSAATHDEKEEWIKCIRQSISHNPFYDLLAKRKKNIQKNNS
ncbi:cytohesin-1 isoform X2 [Hyalella azteca]|uniref:Cytohesin-1 isoform X2 n=1 Tax=Hyalella azteca TaxID=294128 RepID=A0A8B7NKY0_HYAAZ|nr:cytohesin-1 isoform X2 [Hyalella azteca]